MKQYLTRFRDWLYKLLGGLPPSNTQNNTPTTTTPVPTTSGGVATNTTDLRVDALEGRMDNIEKTVNKHHGEQRSIIIGAILACLLIVVTVAGEVIMFNGDFKDSLDGVQKQQRDDYQALQNELNRAKDNLQQEILQTSLNQKQ